MEASGSARAANLAASVPDSDPTLIIIRDRDVAPQILMANNIHAHISGSKKVLIEGADHIVNMSKPEEFNGTVLEFLRPQTQEIKHRFCPSSRPLIIGSIEWSQPSNVAGDNTTI